MHRLVTERCSAAGAWLYQCIARIAGSNRGYPATKRFSAHLLTITGLLAFPLHALGQCSTPQADNSPTILTVDGFNPPAFDPNVPDGTVLYSYTGNATGPSGRVSCPTRVGYVTYNVTTGAASAHYSYLTSIPGVGVAIRSRNTGAARWPTSYVHNQSDTVRSYTGILGVVIDLVKIGPITAPGTLSGELGGVFIANGTFQYLSLRLSDSVPITPQVPTCTTSYASPVALGETPLRAFTGIGALGEARPFTITLRCSGGASGSVTNAHMTMTDQTNPGNRSEVLSLSPDSSASGIGIRISQGDHTVAFGPDSDIPGVENQWKAMSSVGNGSHLIPLVGRYIQTSETVTAGTANGRVTFTMSYQ